MTPEQLSDLAFDFAEKSITPEERDVIDYLEANKVPYYDWEYFLVFMKHWIQIKVDLNFADVLMNLSYYLDGKNEPS